VQATAIEADVNSLTKRFLSSRLNREQGGAEVSARYAEVNPKMEEPFLGILTREGEGREGKEASFLVLNLQDSSLLHSLTKQRGIRGNKFFEQIRSKEHNESSQTCQREGGKRWGGSKTAN